MNNIFQEVKERVPIKEAICYYGFTLNKHDFICCPFHTENTASCKIYTATNTWHCFGCGRSGSIIDFAMHLFHMDKLDAIRQLNRDFMLNLPIDASPTEAQKAAYEHQKDIGALTKAFEKWRNAFRNKLDECCRSARIIVVNCTDIDTLSESEALLIKWHSAIEYWSETLSYGTDEEQMEIFKKERRYDNYCTIYGSTRK